MANNYCKYCGRRLSDSAVFCPGCGKRVGSMPGSVHEPEEVKRASSAKKKKKSNDSLSIAKMLVLFIAIFVICIAIVFGLMTRDTNLVVRNSPTPTQFAASSATDEPTAEPAEEPTPTPTPSPTPKPTPTPAPKNGNYSNARYGFSISYPSSVFTSSSGADNGDGIILKGKDIKATVSGSNNVFHKSIDDLYESAILTSGLTYKVKKDDYYVISGVKDGNIYYIKEYVGFGSINTLNIEYPSGKKKAFDSAVNTLAGSFKHGDLSSAH